MDLFHEERISTTFEEILTQPQLRDIFHSYLTTQHCEENLDFYIAVNEYKEMDDESSRSEKGGKIYAEFVDRINAKSMINIDDEVSSTLSRRIVLEDDFDIHLFDDAEKWIFQLMAKGSFMRFIRSVEYFDLVHLLENRDSVRHIPEAFCEKFISDCRSVENWDESLNKGGVIIYSKEDCFKCVSLINSSVDDIIPTIDTEELKDLKKWYKTLLELEHIEKISEELDIFYMATKPTSMKKKKGFSSIKI